MHTQLREHHSHSSPLTFVLTIAEKGVSTERAHSFSYTDENSTHILFIMFKFAAIIIHEERQRQQTRQFIKMT